MCFLGQNITILPVPLCVHIISAGVIMVSGFVSELFHFLKLQPVDAIISNTFVSMWFPIDVDRSGFTTKVFHLHRTQWSITLRQCPWNISILEAQSKPIPGIGISKSV